MSNEKGSKSVKGVKGFWCSRCNYGSTTAKAFVLCPQCGVENLNTRSSPFPPKPTKIGSTNPNGKTTAVRKPTGTAQQKILERLAARKKFDAAHGTSKGKHIHTIPGSTQKGGGW